jgi:hypothetical protein
MKPIFAVAAVLSAAICGSASYAEADGGCAKVVDAAALRAVNRIPVIGQTSARGSPFMIKPGVMRVGVEVFGPQTQIYAVDVTIDDACRVLATSTRLESQSENPR